MPSRLQQRARSDAGQLQQLRRVDRAAAQQHLAPAPAPGAARRSGGIRRRPRACPPAARGGSARASRRAGWAGASPASGSPTAVEQRRRPRTVSCSGPTPSCSAPLKSALYGYPASCAASISASCSGWSVRRSETPSGPPVPWNSFAPCSWSSALRKYGSTSSYDQPALPSWRHRSKSCLWPRM